MEPEIISTVPLPAQRSEYSRVNSAIEAACEALTATAVRLGLSITPMHLMYLPTQELTADFQRACRAILSALQS
jgi:hypothetical protein